MDKNDYSNAVFWIATEKIAPNPFQPRKEFKEDALARLSDSIRQYGVLQPLVVVRVESEKEDGGIVVSYELIAGERRLRAAKAAGVAQVPCIIRAQEETNKAKLEMALIENIQREDLNPVDRARAFQSLAQDFNLTHTHIAESIGKSREFVSNSIRVLAMPELMLTALFEGRITEGHARTILMLSDRPEEQETLYKEILVRRLSVREAEGISRRIAKDRIRKREKIFDRETFDIEQELEEQLGTRVHIEKKQDGGKIMIEYFSSEDLKKILDVIINKESEINEESESTDAPVNNEEVKEKEDDSEDLYSIKNFSI